MNNTFITLTTGSALLSAFAAWANPWPQYRGPRGDGISTEHIDISWPAEGPKRLWRSPTSNGFSSFSLDDGKAFTIVSREVDGKPSEVCLALDALSGKELWATAVGQAKYDGGGDSGAPGNGGGDGPRSTPTAHAGHVYVYSSNLLLSCLDSATGKVQWNKNIISEFGGKNIGWESAQSPVVDGDLVFIAGGGPDKSMLAFKTASGELAWKSGSEAMTHATPVVASIEGVPQVIFLMQSGLVAVEASSGKPLWKFTFPYKVSTACSPVVAGNIVFCTAGYDVGGAACQVEKQGEAFEARQIWKNPGNKAVASLWSTPVAKDGYLYGMISFKKFATGPLKCVDLKTGQVKWEQPGFGAGNVLLVGNHLLALADDGQVVVVEASPDSYKEVARFKAIAGKCWSTPALSDGRLYVRSTKEGACFDLSAAK